MSDVLIIGGGFAGLINSILLSRSGLNVVLLEKKQYPFHRVCGEYVSNEVIPFLENHDLFPADHKPVRIEKLQLTSTSGRSFSQMLDLGGFGISRYTYDHWLARKAVRSGVVLNENCSATSVSFGGEEFEVRTQDERVYISKVVIAAHGKRSMLDRILSRSFLNKKSPYVGIKYHALLEFEKDKIALHNFSGGYCGVSMIEDDRVNICYMAHRDELKKYGSIPSLEKNVLFKNPYLKKIFADAELLFEKPEVINEITFEKKEPVYNHIFMTGDSAGSITPLCGNGMAMAIHSARLLSDIIFQNWNDGDFTRNKAEQEYDQVWNSLFARRLWMGRQIQNLFGGSFASELAVFTGRYFKSIANALIRQTHGQPFG